MTALIDKRAFLAGVTCQTQGWRVLRAPKGELTPGVEWRFHVGNEIGRVATELLGDGASLPRSPLEAARGATIEFLADPSHPLAYEATFTTDDFIARADAIRRNGDSWDVIEVKSGKLPDKGNPDKGVKSAYIDDLGFTTLVAEDSGLDVARSLLVLVRGEYRYGEPLIELLGELDVTERVHRRVAEFRAVAPQVAAGLRAEARPHPTLVFACKDCPFYRDGCIGEGVDGSLFDLPRLSAKRFEEFKPYRHITALPSDAKLTDTQRRVAEVVRSGEPLVEPDGLKHLDAVVWPAYYLDFESVGPAIPWFPGSAPYEAIPFQFSIHVCDAPGQEVAYHKYLAPLDADWREELAALLVEHLADRGSILMYSSYEARMLRYLASTLPDLAPQLGALEERLYDLEKVFKNGYCDPAFRGRTSIKSTLPAMISDPGYESLEVRNGNDAAGLFALMRVGKYTDAECAKHKENLLAYCKLDTLAMVRLHNALADIRAGVR